MAYTSQVVNKGKATACQSHHGGCESGVSGARRIACCTARWQRRTAVIPAIAIAKDGVSAQASSEEKPTLIGT